MVKKIKELIENVGALFGIVIFLIIGKIFELLPYIGGAAILIILYLLIRG